MSNINKKVLASRITMFANHNVDEFLRQNQAFLAQTQSFIDGLGKQTIEIPTPNAEDGDSREGEADHEYEPGGTPQATQSTASAGDSPSIAAGDPVAAFLAQNAKFLAQFGESRVTETGEAHPPTDEPGIETEGIPDGRPVIVVISQEGQATVITRAQDLPANATPNGAPADHTPRTDAPASNPAGHAAKAKEDDSSRETKQLTTAVVTRLELNDVNPIVLPNPNPKGSCECGCPDCSSCRESLVKCCDDISNWCGKDCNWAKVSCFYIYYPLLCLGKTLACCCSCEDREKAGLCCKILKCFFTCKCD